MSKYYVSGYKTPDDVKNSDDVKKYQQFLGVKTDGIWGKNTQSAYENYIKSKNISSENVLGDFDWDKAADSISSKLTEALRPSVDEAIKKRRESYKTAKAEIDVDAASRGMEKSSFVSSMKDRQASDMNSDISSIEADYNSTLASNLYSALMSMYDTHTQKQISQQQIELEREKMQQQKELAQAELEYKKKQSASYGSSSSDETDGKMPKMGYDYSNYYTFVRMLSDEGKKDLFESDGVYWSWARQQIIADIGKEGFYVLYNQFMSKASGDKANASYGYPTNEIQ